MSRVDTSNGLGGGRLTENPNPPSPKGGTQPQAQEPAPSSGKVPGGTRDPEGRPSSKPGKGQQG